MPSEDTTILGFNQYRNYVIYAYLECFIKRIDGCKNKFEKSSTTEVGEIIPYGYSVSTIWALHGIENNHDVYRGEDCMKKF